ncbi:hypothetical protein Tco_0390024 [Tanacetum coccineum]
MPIDSQETGFPKAVSHPPTTTPELPPTQGLMLRARWSHCYYLLEPFQRKAPNAPHLMITPGTDDQTNMFQANQEDAMTQTWMKVPNAALLSWPTYHPQGKLNNSSQ